MNTRGAHYFLVDVYGMRAVLPNFIAGVRFGLPKRHSLPLDTLYLPVDDSESILSKVAYIRRRKEPPDKRGV